MNELRLDWKPWSELAPQAPKTGTTNHTPGYGRYLEDFRPGDVYAHPRAITFHADLAQSFATTFMESCPLFLCETYPKELGFSRQPVSPLMVLATALSLGVQNESEKAIAHLGYYDVCFPNVCYVGDTLRSMTRVVDKRQSEPGKPGIVHVQTLGINQAGHVVVRYERKIMIPPAPVGHSPQPAPGTNPAFPWLDACSISLPKSASKHLAGYTAGRTFFEDFRAGDVILHANGRTVTDEHYAWTYRLGNTHPLHFDAVYTRALTAPMGGEPVAYGALVFSWIAGLASRDTTENMVWDLGYTQGYHTQPTREGDTLYALTRVLATEQGPSPDLGILQLQLIGLKNQTPADAIKRHGHELFIKENDKKKLGLEKLPTKIFEIERRVLVRKRGAK